MKLSEYKNEDALELLCDIAEPIATILADKDIEKALKSGKANNIGLVKIAIKNHKQAIIEVLARLDGIEVKDANYTIFGMVTKLIEILSDKELIDFFISQRQTED